MAPERAHYCDLCQKDFPRRSELNRHLTRSNIHRDNDDAVYEMCPLCDKKFGQRGNLISHMKRIHGPARPRHECPDCEADFSEKGSLLKHRKRVHGYETKKKVSKPYDRVPTPSTKYPSNRVSSRCARAIHENSNNQEADFSRFHTFGLDGYGSSSSQRSFSSRQSSQGSTSPDSSFPTTPIDKHSDLDPLINVGANDMHTSISHTVPHHVAPATRSDKRRYDPKISLIDPQEHTSSAMDNEIVHQRGSPFYPQCVVADPSICFSIPSAGPSNAPSPLIAYPQPQNYFQQADNDFFMNCSVSSAFELHRCGTSPPDILGCSDFYRWELENFNLGA